MFYSVAIHWQNLVTVQVEYDYLTHAIAEYGMDASNNDYWIIRGLSIITHSSHKNWFVVRGIRRVGICAVNNKNYITLIV